MVVLALMAVACGKDLVPIPAECNGSIELCARRFDEIAYATTHNAMSNLEDGWTVPNQNLNIVHQLEAGVRGLMLDAHEWDDDVLLCHGLCQLGSVPLDEGLRRIRKFLRENRGEVVTIIFESHVPAQRIVDAFGRSDADQLVHAHVAGTPWPTLRELIDADERLVVLTDNAGDGSYDWYMDAWAHAFENPYTASEIEDFSCDVNRGNGANPLFIFNHFLSDPLAQPDSAATVNANPLLIDRARECMAARSHLPNFITLDFFDEGDLMATVAALNGL